MFLIPSLLRSRRSLLIGLAPLLWLLLACLEPPVEPPPECSSSADCVGLASDIGGLCKDGACVTCASAADCEADPSYGDGAVCVSGQCTTCVAGETGCDCLDGQYCLEGGGCEGGVCQPCQAGAVGCPCDGEACDPGLSCDSERCVPQDCAAGSEDCACDSGACDDGLACGDGTCRACPESTEGCPCDGAGGCGRNLVCDGDSQRCRVATACSELDCGTGRLCSATGGVRCLDDCETGYRYNSVEDLCEPIPQANCQDGAEASILADCQSQHRDCVETGDSASCGDCLSTPTCYLDDTPPNQVCRLARTCDDCAAEHRACMPSDTCADASCEACLQGFHDEGGVCVAHSYVGDCAECASAHRVCASDDGGSYCASCLPYWTDDGSGACVGVANCEPGADNSIVAGCEAEHRLCVEASLLQDAHCGDCQSAYIEDTAAGLCIANAACESDSTCPSNSDYHCIQLDVTNAAFCRQAPCPDGEVWDRFAQSCKGCSISCPASDALTGQLWPVTDRNGNCVCETQPGYFWDSSTSGGQAVACDLDGDGWINQKVYQILSTALAEYGAFQDDWTPVINARCDFKEVYEFVLVNDWGQQKVIDVATAFGSINGGRSTVTLYETTRNDRDDQNTLPLYGSRAFDPAEVNSLTKACVDTTSDLNDNTVSDYAENQSTSQGEVWQQIFNKLGFFTELYTGFFDSGRYYIMERERCDGGTFALHYASEDPNNDAYWQSCTRRRDSGYDATDPTGYDFAQYSCSSQSNDCAYTWRPDWRPKNTPVTPEPPLAPASFAAIPPHGACDGLDLSAEPWRGMGHYSQFRCAVLKASVTNTRSEVDIDDVAYLDTAPATPEFVHLPYQLNRCGLDVAPGGLTCQAEVDKSVIDALQDKVSWVARRYVAYSDPSGYSGGCINEWAEWPQLCPGYLEASDPDASIKGDGQHDRFGLLACGCGYNYGGVACDQGCPDSDLLYSPDYRIAPRSGYWLCGSIAASEALTLAQAPPSVDAGSEDASASTGYTLRGLVPAHAGGTATLCQGQAVDGGVACEDGGWMLR